MFTSNKPRCSAPAAKHFVRFASRGARDYGAPGLAYQDLMHRSLQASMRAGCLAQGAAPVDRFLRNEWLGNLHSRSRQAREALYPTTVTVNVHLPFQCSYGQNVFILGSDSSLGSWDAYRAVPLEWSPGDVWKAKLQLQAGQRVEYKYVLKGPDGCVERWQEGDNSLLDLTQPPAAAAAAVAGLELLLRESWCKTDRLLHWCAQPAPAEESEGARPPPAAYGEEQQHAAVMDAYHDAAEQQLEASVFHPGAPDSQSTDAWHVGSPEQPAAAAAAAAAAQQSCSDQLPQPAPDPWQQMVAAEAGAAAQQWPAAHHPAADPYQVEAAVEEAATEQLCAKAAMAAAAAAAAAVLADLLLDGAAEDLSSIPTLGADDADAWSAAHPQQQQQQQQQQQPLSPAPPPGPRQVPPVVAVGRAGRWARAAAERRRIVQQLEEQRNYHPAAQQYALAELQHAGSAAALESAAQRCDSMAGVRSALEKSVGLAHTLQQPDHMELVRADMRLAAAATRLARLAVELPGPE